MDRPAVIRPSDQGRRIGIVGDVYRFLATGSETGGKYAMFEAIVPPGSGPPPHIHRREEESFWILTGEMTFYYEDERIVAGPGTFLNMPIGSRHAFKNESDQVARMLIGIAPAGLEEMFFEVGTPLSEDAETTSPPDAAEIERLLAAAPRYGVEILPPHP